MPWYRLLHENECTINTENFLDLLLQCICCLETGEGVGVLFEEASQTRIILECFGLEGTLKVI